MNAETAGRSIAEAEAQATLQWGRVLMNAETARIAAFSAVSCTLQWGRVLMNAETAQIDLSRCTCQLPLQWGRVLMNAETRVRQVANSAKARASMGPRSHERGNPTRLAVGHLGLAGFNGAAFS